MLVLRRLLLTCLLPLEGVGEDSLGQVVVGAVIALSFTAFYGFLRPFTEDVTDNFASAIQLILFLNYFSTIVIFADDGHGSEMRSPVPPYALGVFVLVLNAILGPCLAVFSLLFDDLKLSIDALSFSLRTINSVLSSRLWRPTRQLTPVDASLFADAAPGSVDGEPPSSIVASDGDREAPVPVGTVVEIDFAIHPPAPMPPSF